MFINKAAIMVIDGLGCGVMPIHPEEDEGANTLGNVAWWYQQKHGEPIPLHNLQALGLTNLTSVPGLTAVDNPLAAHGICTLDPVAMTDTIACHWASHGRNTGAFPASREDFPLEFKEFLEHKIKAQSGQEVEFLGFGKNISGTEILKIFGKRAKDLNQPILYTSSDSVVQIAYWVGYKSTPEFTLVTGLSTKTTGYAVDPDKVEKMNRLCKLVRKILNESIDPKHHYLRVIARPFVSIFGTDDFERVKALRKDLSLEVPGLTLLDIAKESGLEVASVGKIWDIFSGRGITRAYPSLEEDRHLKDDTEGLDFSVQALCEMKQGIVSINLVRFDEDGAHRNDPDLCAQILINIDEHIPRILEVMGENDVLFIIADHGNDPTRARSKWYSEFCGLEENIYKKKGTNHTREYVPLLVCGKSIKPVNLGIRHLADIGMSIGAGFHTTIGATRYYQLDGKSFWHKITDPPVLK